jgi:hypothetical protein
MTDARLTNRDSAAPVPSLWETVAFEIDHAFAKILSVVIAEGISILGFHSQHQFFINRRSFVREILDKEVL